MSIGRFFNKTVTQRRKGSSTSATVEVWGNISTSLKCCIPPTSPGDSIAFSSVNMHLNITHQLFCWATESIKVGDKIIDGSTTLGADIAFVDGGLAADSITCVAATFLTDGFKVGDVFRVVGSTSNDGEYTILTVVAGTITVATGSLTTEAASATITLTTGDEYIVRLQPKKWGEFLQLYLSEVA